MRPPSDHRRRMAALAVLGLVEAAALAALAWLPAARATPFPALALWGVAWCAMAGAWACARGAGPDPAGAAPGHERPGRRADGRRARSRGADGDQGAGGLLDDRRGRRIVWGVGVAGRLALLPAAPHLSGDVYRFLWDGWVSLHGVNPYLHPPDAAALEPLRTAWHHLVNHPSVSTIYPPGAQAVFHALAAVVPSVLLFKAVWVAADLGVGALLDRLDRRRPGGRIALLLWLWSPLVMVEVAWSGHLEPLGLLPMVAAFAWLDGRRGAGRRGAEAEPGGRQPPETGSVAEDPGDTGRARGREPDRGPADGGRGPGRRSGWRRPSVLGGALLGLGASMKLAPAAALPALWRRHGWRAAAALSAIPLLLLLPYVGAGGALYSGLGEYASRWEFNAGIFTALRSTAGGDAARVAAVATPAALALAGAWRRWTAERTLFWCIGAALLLSPTLHPWYLLWVLPFAALRASPAWILWTGLVFLAYAGLDVYRATGRWPEPSLLRAVIHVPFLALLAAEGLGVAGRLGRGASRSAS